MRYPRITEQETLILIALVGVAVLFGVSAIGAWSSLRAGRGVPDVAESQLAFDDGNDFADDDAADVQVPVAVDSVQPQDAAQAPPTRRSELVAESTVVTTGDLKRGDTLASAMARSNVPTDLIQLVTHHAAVAYDFRRSQPGHRFRLTQALDGRVLDFRYWMSPTESVHVMPERSHYRAAREQMELRSRISRIAGVVDSSLYGAMLALGEEPQLASDFTDVFAWDVDFSRTVQQGDEFQVLYERLYYTDEGGKEVYAGPGRILAAQYGGAVGSHTAVYYESEEGRGGYYRPDGSSVERQFLLAPLRYSRISSSYSLARHHPILNITRPHHGIDYAAASGSPVWSVADGEVIYRGWAGGYGNLVKVRHAKGYVSYYAHLSRYADNLRVGDRVQQKQVIGQVGMTGLATGPHVCFRITQDGRYVNPASLRSPAANPIPAEAREDFYAVRDTLLAELGAGPFVASGEAL